MDNPSYKPTVLSLCSGYGGIERGLSEVFGDVRVLANVEIEAFAAYNLAKKAEDSETYQAPVWTNLKTFPAHLFRDKVDILTGGFPCFTAGHLVLTRDGHKPIESVSVGDEVLTHKGRWRKVLRRMCKVGAETRIITGGGQHGIECTDEHPFYTRERHWKYVQGRKVRCFKDPQWTDSSDLERDTFIGDITPTETISDTHTKEFWWLVGRYLADGYTQWQGRKGRVVYCVGKAKCEEFEKYLEESEFTGCKARERTATKYHITRSEFARFLEQFGKGAGNKLIPGWVFNIGHEKLEALLLGYLSGDGHTEPSGYWRCTTISEKLAYSMSMLGNIVWRCVSQVRKQKTPDTCIIEGRTVNQSDYYTVSFPLSSRCFFRDGDYGWRQIRGNERFRDGQVVYNIEVEEDNSYTVNNIVVHNCQPYSVAGTKRGDEDPRHLFPYFKRIINECRPKYVFLENVRGLLSAKLKGEYWNDPEGTPVLLHVLRELERLGYRVTAGLFSAEEAGAVHLRERVFILGEREGGDSEHNGLSSSSTS